MNRVLRLNTALDDELRRSFQVQEVAEVSYRQLTASRRDLRSSFEYMQDRILEIDTLQSRFDLLAEHYSSDERRLASIIEAGTFFVLEEAETCPVCGADVEHHRPDKACDGDVSLIIAAAVAEMAELKDRAEELKVTVQGLTMERKQLAEQSRSLLPELSRLQSEIQLEVPSVQSVRNNTTRVIEEKVKVQKGIDLLRNLEKLIGQRAQLGVSPGYDSSTIIAQQQLDGAVLDAFSLIIEAELQAWDFPDARRVFFDLQRMDISVAGKARGANGKGVRALLHGAFDVGLMKYCYRNNNQHAHPGFLVLDSLFITYKDPTDLGDAAIARTPLKDKAFQALATLPSALQLIVLENVDVPDWLAKHPQCVHFTGQPSVGRSGLFPSSSQRV